MIVTSPGVAWSTAASVVRIAARIVWITIVVMQEPLAGEPVGERAADQPGEGAGHERGGRDDPGPARLVGLLGDEDPDADRLHPGADVGDERAEPEPRVRAVAERRERAGERHSYSTKSAARGVKMASTRSAAWGGPSQP